MTKYVSALAIWMGLCAGAAEPPLIPNDRLTPGVIATSDPAVVCHPNYSKTVRHTSGKLKHEVYREYGIDPKSGRFEIDHRVPLSLGGADVKQNLWTQSYSTKPWNATEKDKLEVFALHSACYHHTMTLREAQQLFLGDWREAYRQYLGEPPK